MIQHKLLLKPAIPPAWPTSDSTHLKTLYTVHAATTLFYLNHQCCIINFHLFTGLQAWFLFNIFTLAIFKKNCLPTLYLTYYISTFSLSLTQSEFVVQRTLHQCKYTINTTCYTLPIMNVNWHSTISHSQDVSRVSTLVLLFCTYLRALSAGLMSDQSWWTTLGQKLDPSIVDQSGLVVDSSVKLLWFESVQRDMCSR